METRGMRPVLCLTSLPQALHSLAQDWFGDRQRDERGTAGLQDGLPGEGQGQPPRPCWAGGTSCSLDHLPVIKVIRHRHGKTF